jgi:hypothetical protein
MVADLNVVLRSSFCGALNLCQGLNIVLHLRKMREGQSLGVQPFHYDGGRPTGHG